MPSHLASKTLERRKIDAMENCETTDLVSVTYSIRRFAGLTVTTTGDVAWVEFGRGGERLDLFEKYRDRIAGAKNQCRA